MISYTYRLLCLAVFGVLFGTGVLHGIEPSLSDIEYAVADGRSLKLDLYLPSASVDGGELAPAIVWVHGGAWREGSKSDVPIAKLCDMGFAIASVDYRLSGQARFPAQIHDIKAAIRFLKTSSSEYQLDRERFVVAGSSAGGHLAALVGVSSGVKDLEGNIGLHVGEDSKVHAIISFFGASNLQTILSQSTEYGLLVRVPALELFLGQQPQDAPDLARLASPVTHVDKDDPPIWLIHGDSDPQMPIEQSYELADVYRTAKIPVAMDVVVGGKHGGEEFYSPTRLEKIASEVKASLHGKKPIRMLFAGSSSAYWNDLPNEVAKCVSSESSGVIMGRNVTADLVGRSGSDIRVYQDPNCDYQYGVKRGQSFLDKIRQEQFDYVVLMTVCRFIMGDGDNNIDGAAHREAVTNYCNEIRNAGGEPIFYEVGWGDNDREASGRARILELAKQNNIKIFVPCSTAWARVRSERPDLELQHPNDSSHPGDNGHFLNLACFYAALTHSSPEGKLNRTFHVWPHHSKSEKETLKEKLDSAFASFKPDAYQSRLPEWMRRNAGAGYRGNISELDARYLEKVAWEIHQAIAEELR